MNAIADGARDSGDQDGAHPRMPSKRLDQKGVLFEKLGRFKKERLGNSLTVGTRRNEIDALVSSEKNVQLVKKSCPAFWLILKHTKMLFSPIRGVFKMKLG